MRFKIARLQTPIFALVKYAGKIAWTHWVNIPGTGYEYVEYASDMSVNKKPGSVIDAKKRQIDNQMNKKDNHGIKVTEAPASYAGLSGKSLSEINSYDYGVDSKPIPSGSYFDNDDWEAAPVNKVRVDSEGRLIAVEEDEGNIDDWYEALVNRARFDSEDRVVGDVEDEGNTDDWEAAPVNRVRADSEGRLIADVDDEGNIDDWYDALVNRARFNSEGRVVADVEDEGNTDDWEAAPVNRVRADSEGRLIADEGDEGNTDDWEAAPVNRVRADSEGRLIADVEDEGNTDDWDEALVNRARFDSKGRVVAVVEDEGNTDDGNAAPVVPIKSELKIIKIELNNRQSNVEILTKLLDHELLKNPSHSTGKLIQNLLISIKNIDLSDPKEIYLGLQDLKAYIIDWEKNNFNEDAEKNSPNLLKLMEVFKTNNSTFEEVLEFALKHKELAEIIEGFNIGPQNSEY
ncbi:hypothetical protein [Legionella sp. WA2024007413]